MTSAPLINLRELLRKDIASLGRIAEELAVAQAARNQAHAAFMTAEMQAQHLFSQYDALRRSVLERQAALRIMATDALPDDILAEIFLHTMPSREVPAWQPGPTVDAPTAEIDRQRAKTPWRLARVSKRWHSVAMHTPRLWSYVAVFEPGYSESSRQRVFSGTKHILELSKCSPLDVAIVVRNVDDPLDSDEEDEYSWDTNRQPRLIYEQHAHLARIFRLLYANAPRVRSLQIHGLVNGAISKEFAKQYPSHLEDIRELAVGFCSLPTPALEELCLVFQKGQDDTKLRETTIDITLPIAPRLRRLRVDHVPAFRRTSHSGFPMLEAVSLTSGDLPLLDICQTVRLCPALLDFYLDVEDCEDDLDDSPPLDLLTVRNLTLKGAGLSVFPDYAIDDQLPLPKLATLGVDATYVYPGFMFDLKDKLTTCAVLGGELTVRALEGLFQLAVVENVSITSSLSDVYAPLVQALQKDDPPVWPKMRNFELFLTCGFDDRGEALAGALKKRLELARAADPKVVSLERIAVSKEHRVANWVVAELGAHIGMNNVVVSNR